MDYENTQIKKDDEDNRLFNNLNELMCKIKWRNLLEQKGNEIAANFFNVKDLDSYTDFFVEYDLQTENIYIKPESDLYKENKHSANNIKEKNNMLKILENYQIKKETEIENKYDKQLKDLENSDPVTLLLKETEESIKEMLNSENVRLVISSDVFEFTKETVDKKNGIINTIREEKQKLRTKISEIESLLELAPNYEEKLQILRDYDIMDKKKNIIL